MIKKILLSIALKLLDWSSDVVFKYVDSDSDGKLSKEEITNAIQKVRNKFNVVISKMKE